MFRRKRMPSDLVPLYELFSEQAVRVEQARQALLSCLPVGRVDPVPIPVGLDVVEDELDAVAKALPRWRCPTVELQWLACRDAVGEAVENIPQARRVADSTTELEELLEAVGEVTEPLDAWYIAERHWLSLRFRSG